MVPVPGLIPDPGILVAGNDTLDLWFPSRIDNAQKLQVLSGGVLYELDTPRWYVDGVVFVHFFFFIIYMHASMTGEDIVYFGMFQYMGVGLLLRVQNCMG